MSRGPISMSFVKKPLKKANTGIPGTHPSIYNNLLLTSTGIPSLDCILGGGLPVGSVLLIEEDLNNRFSNVMLKYVLAEGVACQHSLCCVNDVSQAHSLIDDLPKLVPKDITNCKQKSSNSDMQIAFRYHGKVTTQSPISNVSKQGHYYDVTKKMDQAMIDKCEIEEILLEEFLESCWEEEDMLRFVLTAIKSLLTKPKYKMPENADEIEGLNIMRIVIPSFASPFWCPNGNKNSHHISQFLACLRAVVRSRMAICVITVPSQLYTEKHLKMFRHMTDAAISLKSFAGEKKNKLFKQYHGLFNIKKLPCLNALKPYVPETLDLAFELKRTKFVIEYLHLPPDLSETASRQGSNKEVIKNKNSACSSSAGSKLDF